MNRIFFRALLGLALGGAAASAATPITITVEPLSQTVVPGSTTVFSLAATSNAPLSYQWYYSGSAVTGASSPRLILSNASASNAGDYTCVVTNTDSGSATSWVATLTVATSNDPGRLANVSVLTPVAVNGTLTVGITTGGNGTSGSQTLLVRAIGPTLAAFGVSPVMSDPSLKILEQDNKALMASNDNWGTNQAQVSAAEAATGAFTLPSTSSLDAALVTSLPSAAHQYSALVTANGGGSGSVLAEFYDYTSNYTVTTPRLINLSTLSQVTAGATLSAGFVLSGNTARTVLIRAVGPSLAALGVQGVMADPKLTLYQTQGSNQTVIATNAGWGGDPQIASIDTYVGAFALSPTGTDSAILITLMPQSPGGIFNYSAQATSASGGAGNVLIEVYEVP